MLVGNKCDLPRTVNEKDIKSLIEQEDIKYFEVSALNGVNISLPFEFLAQQYHKNKNPKEPEPIQKIIRMNDLESTETKSNCNC